jgi:hypothetical protein
VHHIDHGRNFRSTVGVAILLFLFLSGLAVRASAQSCYLWADESNAGGETGQVAAVIGMEQAAYDQNYDRTHGNTQATFTYVGTTCVDPPTGTSSICYNQINVTPNLPRNQLQNFQVGPITKTGAACPQYWLVATPQPQCEVCSGNPVGHPINPGTGSVYSREEDVHFFGAAAISFQRFYDSAALRTSRCAVG